MLLPTGDARFAARLAEAHRLRDALPSGGAAAAALEAAGLLSEAPLPDDEEWADAVAVLRKSLLNALTPLPGPLERLHEHCCTDGTAFSPARADHAAVMAAKKGVLAPLANPARAQGFAASYDAFIIGHVAPYVASCMPGCTELHYATLPTLRVATPSAAVASIRPHADGIYDLPPGSLNFWLPLTEVCEASALWVESAPGRADYHPLMRATRFDGRACVHFTLPNSSPRTRVSLDFRCVPGTLFDRGGRGRLSRLGYWSTAAATPSRNGAWEKRATGRVSKLHGLPHTAPPVEIR